MDDAMALQSAQRDAAVLFATRPGVRSSVVADEIGKFEAFFVETADVANSATALKRSLRVLGYGASAGDLVEMARQLRDYVATGVNPAFASPAGSK